MLRKATGTPFKLRSGTPLKKDKLPDGVTTSSRDLGQMANDENQLVNVTENTTTTPDYSGNAGKVVKASKNRCGIEVPWSDPRCVAYSKMSDDEIKESEQNQGLREGYEPAQEGGEEVSYETTPIPQPGTPGDETDPFTAAEGRNQFKYNKQSANRAIKAAKRVKKANDGTVFSRLFTKDGRAKGKAAKEAYQNEKSEILSEAADAAQNMSRNSNDQLTQGRNAWRSGEKVGYRKEMSKGTEGQDFTIAPEGTKKLSSLTGSQSTNANPFSGMEERLQELKDFKLTTGPKYGRSKAPTPFKLNKYKK
jgi:hypothetical protein